MAADGYSAQHVGVTQITTAEWTTIFQEVNTGHSSTADIARKHEIPPSTLSTRLHTRNAAQTSVALGAPPAMPAYVEERLATWCADRTRAGVPLTRQDFSSAVAEISSQCGLTRVKGGPQYINNFLQRHTEAGSLARATPVRPGLFHRVIVAQWFAIFRDVVKQCSSAELFNVGDKIFNSKAASPTTAVGGAGDVVTHTGLTVCGNAAGDMMPPFFTFAGNDTDPPKDTAKVEQVVTSLRQAIPDGINFAITATGTPDDASWYCWCVEFVGFMQLLGLTKALLICDVGARHECFAAIQLLSQHNVRLWRLPPASICMQPVHVGYFGELKSSVDKEIGARGGKAVAVTEAELPGLVCLACERVAAAGKSKGKLDGLVGAFAKCGLFPCDPEALPESAFKRSDGLLGYSATHEDVLEAKKATSADFHVVVDSTKAALSPEVSSRLKARVRKSGFDLSMTAYTGTDEVGATSTGGKAGAGQADAKSSPADAAASSSASAGRRSVAFTVVKGERMPEVADAHAPAHSSTRTTGSSSSSIGTSHAVETDAVEAVKVVKRVDSSLLKLAAAGGLKHGEAVGVSFARVAGGRGVQSASGSGDTSSTTHKTSCKSSTGKAHVPESHTLFVDLVPTTSIPRPVAATSAVLAGSKRKAVDIAGGSTDVLRGVKAAKHIE